MKPEGVRGFKSAKYDPEVMGEFIVENLIELEESSRMTAKEKEAFKRAKYPIVMSFFKAYDLQPTLMNLRKNKELILALWSGRPERHENFTGEEYNELTGSSWIIFIALILLLVVILKILN